MIRDVACVLLLAAGGIFFLAGTIGVLRFPDARTRLHAVSKADTAGLGLVIVGLLVLSWGGSIAAGLKLVIIWLLALVSSATASYLIGRHAVEGETDRS